jgi:hypothetical protein
LTHEQLQGWQQAFEQEPWGDFREDMRAVVTMLHARPGGSETTSMMWPYFPGRDEFEQKVKELQAQEKRLGPAHDEKLKEARRKHLEMMKAQKRG